MGEEEWWFTVVKKEEGFARCNITSLHAFPRVAFTFCVTRVRYFRVSHRA